MDYLSKLSWSDSRMKNIPTQDIILGVVGLIIALIIGVLLNFPLSRIPWVGPYITGNYPGSGLSGITFFLNRKDEFSILTFNIMKRPGSAHIHNTPRSSTVKILDTSVIIDGKLWISAKRVFLKEISLSPVLLGRVAPYR